MSCVIAIRHNGTIYMGCDSAVLFYPENVINIVRSPRKIVSVDAGNQHVLLGVTGPYDYLCLIHEEFEGKDIDSPTFQMIRTFINHALKDDPDLWDKFDRSGDPSNILIAIPGEEGKEDKLYRIGSRYSWLELEHDFYAVGSGADLALGALHALVQTQSEELDELTIAAWMTTALEAAETYDVHVERPFYLASTRMLLNETKLI